MTYKLDVQLPPNVERRLRELSQVLGQPLSQVTIQAINALAVEYDCFHDLDDSPETNALPSLNYEPMTTEELQNMHERGIINLEEMIKQHVEDIELT